jgi:hypothetical protein
LQHLAQLGRNAEQRDDLAVDLSNQWVGLGEVAGFAGSEVRDSGVVGDLGRPPPGVDPLDQRGASPGIEKAADNEQLKLTRRNPLDPRDRGEALGRACGVSCRRRLRGSSHAG